MLQKFFTDLSEKVGGYMVRHFSDQTVLFLSAAVMGILCGSAAALLKGCIMWVTHFVFSSFKIHQGNWGFLLLPIVGLLIVVLYTRYFAKGPLDHASERLADDLKNNVYKLSPRYIWGSIITCSITLGMGGSAGAESPIAYTSGAIGSNIGRILRLPPERIENLLGCGAAAGIAGIYMAPIGGMMFALEVLKMKQSLETALALTLSSLTAALTCYLLLGCHTDVTFVPEMRFDTSLIPHVIACGALCGLYSLYYRLILRRFRVYLGKIKNVWYKALTGGVTLAVLLFFFPSLYGEGYGILGDLMVNDATSIISYGPFYRWGSENFNILMVLFVALLLVKPIATSATNDSGGVAGEFTPTFFCGGVAGFLFAAFVNHYLGMHVPYALFSFFGMAAVMAGSVQAPLMAIFIAAEMTGMYGFILPLTIAAMASYVTTRLSVHIVTGHTIKA